MKGLFSTQSEEVNTWNKTGIAIFNQRERERERERDYHTNQERTKCMGN